MNTDLAISTDFSGLGAMKADAGQDPEVLKAAARQFEALFVQMMLKSMRDAGAVLGEERKTDYEEMFDREVSMHLTAQKGIGLADVMLRQLAPTAGSNEIETRPETTLATTPLRRFAGTAQSAGGVADLPTAGREDFRPRDHDDFIRSVWPHAERAAERLGTDAKAIVAQAALETGWGQKQIRDRDGVSGNNLFGIKADGRWPGPRLAVRTLEYADGIAHRQTDNFRAYPDLGQGFDDYVEFLQTNPRYGMSADTRLNGDDYVQRLQSAGYATDPRYAEKIQDIMNSDRLEKTIADIKVNADAPTL
ncbi:MAG: flagellar assembly peptidoglycan hydrolase FlgJ [Gammaproteobacteria bacterium]